MNKQSSKSRNELLKEIKKLKSKLKQYEKNLSVSKPLKSILERERDQLLSIFGAALDNPRIDSTARASLLNSLRAYYQDVIKDNELALRYADQAVRTSPERWHYRDRQVRLLAKMDRASEAHEKLDLAIKADKKKRYKNEAAELIRFIDEHSTGQKMGIEKDDND